MFQKLPYPESTNRQARLPCFIENVRDDSYFHSALLVVAYLLIRQPVADRLPQLIIKNHQKYGVTFFSQIQKQDGSIGIVERGFKIDEPMMLSELINGKSDCYVNKSGIKVKGWRGAKNEWLAMMDDEFHNDECLDAWGVVNCMVKV